MAHVHMHGSPPPAGFAGGTGPVYAGAAGSPGIAAGGGAGAAVGAAGGSPVVGVGGAGMAAGGVRPAGIAAGAIAAPGVAGGGCMGSTGCGVGCGSSATGNLAFVGEGRGDWVTETTYKYVGTGAGDLSVVTARRVVWPWICLAVVLLLAILALLLGPHATSTTIKAAVVLPARPENGNCIFWGDPHLVTFDGSRPSFYGDGEFWIVKNKDVHIQGRYMGTKYTYGLAATQKVAIGGPFLGHVIEVEPMEHAYGGHIWVDGKQVLPEFGTLKVGDATITYDGRGELIDEATSKWTTRTVHLDLPMGIKMTIFRWSNYLDLKIEMPKLEGGQDGSCGNFNGDPSDDTPAKIFERIGARVSEEDLMFAHRAVVTITHEEEAMFAHKCPQTDTEKARQACEKEMPAGATEAQMVACAFDYCFGMEEHALRTATEYATKEDREAAHSADFE